MNTYTIILNKTTGESQTQWSSESHEKIMKLWEEEKISLVEARNKGWLRSEGKEYEVEEGDVMEFLFNV